MENVSLNDKQKYISYVTGIIYSDKEIDANKKMQLYKDALGVIGQPITKEQLNAKMSQLVTSLNLIGNQNIINNYDNDVLSSQSYIDSSSNVLEKPKVKTYTIKNNTFNDSAFVDAALVGLVTFYAGILGVCSILTQMQ